MSEGSDENIRRLGPAFWNICRHENDSPSSRTPVLSHRLSSASSLRCGTEPAACATSKHCPDAGDDRNDKTTLRRWRVMNRYFKTTKYFKRSSLFHHLPTPESQLA